MRRHFDLFGCSVRFIVVFVLCSLGISKASAQRDEKEYVPFVEEGKSWYCGYGHPEESFPITAEDPLGLGIDCIFTMYGDTLVNDREYKKVHCQFEEYYGDKEQHYYCAVREEAYQVFIIEENTMEEKLIYDFSHPGETIMLTYNDYKFARSDGWCPYGHCGYDAYLPGQWEYVVGKLTDGELDYSHDSSFWIEGVGAYLNNPFAFELTFLPFDKSKLDKNIYVLTCMKAGKYLFNIEWTAEPMNPSSIDYSSHPDNNNKGSHLYDLNGRQLNGTPQKGVYIKNGKKYVK